jgi:hypothetical protein
MNRTITKWALAVLPLGLIVGAALAVAPGIASAYDLARDDYSPDVIPSSFAALMQMKPMEVMHDMDKGKKDYVTKAEFTKYMDAVYDKMDQNKDGKVSADEWLMKVWKGQ